MRDIARASRTCHEFQQAYLDRVAEMRAEVIALGKDLYGKDRFSGIVRAVQRGMRGLDPCPGISLGDGRWRINGTGDPEVLAREAQLALGPSMDMFRCELPCHVIRAHARVNLPSKDVPNHCSSFVRISSIFLDLRKSRAGGLYWSVEIGKEGAAAAMGLLLATCTDNPQTLTPCFERPGTMKVRIRGLSRGSASLRKREAEEVIGPFGLLPELLTVHPPLGEVVQAGSRGVLKWVTVSWD
jgi:hypothetical protein